MINSLLDTDFYKLLMMQAVFHQYKDFKVEYDFICRNKDVNLNFLKSDVQREVNNISKLKFTKEEIKYLKNLTVNNQKVFKPDFINYLKTFTLNKNHVKISNGLKIKVKGPWLKTILWEIYLLSIVNELYFNQYHSEEVFQKGTNLLKEKIELLKVNPIKFSEFGTRRRFSRMWQQYVVNELKEVPGYIGTSNVLLSKKFNTTPIGTHAHEFFQAHQSIDYLKSQELTLKSWMKEYSNFKIALSDIYGTKAFLRKFNSEFSNYFDGLRHDSGNPYHWTDLVLKHYKSQGIDPMTKTLIFSDNLNIPKAIELKKYCENKVNCVFGIGTNLSNDLGIPSINIVLKMVKCNNKDVVKISDEPIKAIGNQEIIKMISNHFENCPSCGHYLNEEPTSLSFMNKTLISIPVNRLSCNNCNYDFIPSSEISRAENDAYSKEDVIDKAKEVLGKNYKEWLNQNNQALGNKKPKDLLKNNRYDVFTILIRIEHGVYS